jgi:hypothetical protein
MTYAKLKELLEGMTETQLHKEVVACNDVQGQHDILLKIKDIRLLRDDEESSIYPALVA